MPMRKTSSEKKRAATRFLWILWMLDRNVLMITSKMKVSSKAASETDTEVYVMIFRGSTSPFCYGDNSQVILCEHVTDNDIQRTDTKLALTIWFSACKIFIEVSHDKIQYGFWH